MKRLMIFMMAVVAGLAVNAQQYPELEIGEVAPLMDYKMKDISGESYALNDLKEENGLLVIFSCNACPWVLLWEDRYNGLASWAKMNKVGFVLVNSNYKKFDGADSYENMKKHANEKGYNNLNYVMDADSKLANATGARTTPHVFLYDGSMKLAYKGSLDDNAKDKDEVRNTYVKDALSALGAGSDIAVSSTPSNGCSIKRKM